MHRRCHASVIFVKSLSDVGYWHFASFAATQHFGRYWSNSKHRGPKLRALLHRHASCPIASTQRYSVRLSYLCSLSNRTAWANQTTLKCLIKIVALSGVLCGPTPRRLIAAGFGRYFEDMDRKRLPIKATRQRARRRWRHSGAHGIRSRSELSSECALKKTS
jgi:hypothetical protein